MKDKSYYKQISNDFLERVFNYYLTLEKGELKLISKIAEELNCDEWAIRRVINSFDTEKDVNGEFHSHYKLILARTKFKKDNTEGSHYSNQQEYFKQLEEKIQRREKAKQIALSLYNRQQEEKNGSNKQILEEAKYIIQGHTVDEAAKHFNVSVRTIQLHINVKLKKLAEQDDAIAEIYSELQIMKQKIAKQRMIYGGSVGAKVPTWTAEECEAIARHIVTSDLSIREAAKTLKSWNEEFDNIPKSTLYGRLKQGIKDLELLSLFKSHMEKNKVMKKEK